MPLQLHRFGRPRARDQPGSSCSFPHSAPLLGPPKPQAALLHWTPADMQAASLLEQLTHLVLRAGTSGRLAARRHGSPTPQSASLHGHLEPQAAQAPEDGTQLAKLVASVACGAGGAGKSRTRGAPRRR
ncbi:hypothetical protein GQ55_7G112500 [Panicum hallii var. hallii]|uniref:Uncharacterized protein n=1 Tax=Panicum hallii var. hallii TaxID=1504633 RepID=A0A2T7CTZ2_9POAL|nr:hypothetical protein GQ55_7G112500 [Panicum hallii var. hallii]